MPYGEDVRFISTRKMWECKNDHARRQFSVKVGTIFEDSALGLDKWLTASWMIANCKNGVSSYEIGRALGITQKSAWFMLHRIRLAMQSKSFANIGGFGKEVEADETFIGGEARNMHMRARERRITGNGPKDKDAVLGLLESKGEIRTMHVPNIKTFRLHSEVKKHVEAGSALYADNSRPIADWMRCTRTASLATPPHTSMAASTRTVWKTTGRCSSGRSAEPT